MSWFGRIEEACAAFIERAFANMFPSDLEPAQIARKVVATMEARTEQRDSGMVAPDYYEVFAHPNDFARLSAHQSYLQDEWALLLSDIAERAGITFNRPPQVELKQDDGVTAGAVEIDAMFSASPEELREKKRTKRSTFVLQVVNGLSSATAFRVSGAARVGRNPESDVLLADPSVSRNHALLDVRSDALIVRDAGSTNGTFLNGKKIENAEAHAGDVLTFGTTEVRVQAA